jgi:hypothetical protein
MEVDNDVFGHAVSLFFLPSSASSFCCSIYFSALKSQVSSLIEIGNGPCGWTVHSNTTGLVAQVPHWLCGRN